MNPRFKALKDIEKRNRSEMDPISALISSDSFGADVFNRSLMQKMLPREIYRNIINAMEGSEKICKEHADTIAMAVKEWAMSRGATHYTHWFQPLTGSSAEKHDAFIEWTAPDKVIEKFNGKQLIQGEPDASSFPSGGLRSTYEARGYTGWDPSSPIFLWKGGDGITLCIPSVFFSWTGDVLDTKIPLLRSDKKIDQAAMRLLKLTGISAQYVYSTLGLEQEYFVIDRSLRNMRPDLVLLGKTVFGAPSPKGQELQDHYFGSVKDRILAFMRDFEIEAVKLGIPVKTRHNEVAPAQHEVAPVYEKASTAIDHNILLMELMRQTALKHGLACLLHEKPFAGLNGSGKHANWSLSTDTGINLLDPTNTPHNQLHFLILMTAVLHAVHQHGTLLRASVGSASNDYRLGGHEAPPAIISVYLGQSLEHLLEEIEQKGSCMAASNHANYEWEQLVIPDLSRDDTDRNRTSPLAFTGNKFEFRAVGSLANPAFSATILNLIVAQSLNQLLDEIEKGVEEGKASSTEERWSVAMSVLQKYLKQSKNIRFGGDNYSQEWMEEAKKRGLPNIKRSPEAFYALTTQESISVFKGVLRKEELISRQEIVQENYVLMMGIEVNLMVELFQTQILPAATRHLANLANALVKIKETGLDISSARQQQQVKQLNEAIEKGLQNLDELQQVKTAGEALTLGKRAEFYGQHVLEKMQQLRCTADSIETMVEDGLWPLPKYRELLFMV